MARRLGSEPIKRRKPTKRRSDAVLDQRPPRAKADPTLTLEGFKSRSGLDLEAALVGLGPTIRNIAIGDSKAELYIAWGRCVEQRIGFALVIEDTIRAMAPPAQKNWRENIVRCALGHWHNPEEKV
jgi:hypothetical protein